MPAIVTSRLRKETAASLTPGTVPNNLYVGLGKADAWNNGDTPTLPSTSELESLNVKRNLIGLKQVESNVRLIPRVDLVAGRSYKAWDSGDATCFYPSGGRYPCYAIDTNNRLYMCVDNPASASSVLTNIAEISSLVTYGDKIADGYRWVYLCEVDANAPFNSSQFIQLPEDPVDDSEGTPATDALNATGGRLLKGIIISPGTGYAQTSSDYDIVNVVGDGSGATTAYSVDASGGISFGGVAAGGSGYTYGHPVFPRSEVDPTLDTGTAAQYRLIFAPKLGFGAKLKEDLPSWFVGISVDFSHTATEIPLGQYRQLSIIRMPANLSADYVQTLRKITGIGSIPAGINAGDIISVVQGGVTKRAFISHIDGSTIWVHQNTSEKINILALTAGSITSPNITFFKSIQPFKPVDSGTSGTVDTVPTYATTYAGDVLFVENFRPKQRSSNQTEEIRIVLQL
jgi:hypothetical protein